MHGPTIAYTYMYAYHAGTSIITNTKLYIIIKLIPDTAKYIILASS